VSPQRQIAVQLAERHYEAVEWVLLELGALGVERVAFRADGPRVTLADAVVMRAGFDPADGLEARVEQRLASLMHMLSPHARCHVSWSDVPQRHWSISLDDTRCGPVRVSDRLVVLHDPAGYTPADNEVVLRLHAGQGFGLGDHETTQLSAAAMERLVKPGMRVLDVGCGSGILALFAAALGADAVAVDIDAAAIANAWDNAELSGLEDRVRFVVSPAVEVSGTFDLGVANILVHTLVGLAQEIAQRIRPGGTLVLCGVGAGQVDLVLETYQRHALCEHSRERRGDWALICLQKR